MGDSHLIVDLISKNQTDFFRLLLQSVHTPPSFTDYKFKDQTESPRCQLYSAHPFSWYSYNVCSVQWETRAIKENGSEHLCQNRVSD